MEKEADGILLDNTRYIRNARLNKLKKPYYRPPEMKNRNPDQYWIFWPREAASKTVRFFNGSIPQFCFGENDQNIIRQVDLTRI